MAAFDWKAFSKDLASILKGAFGPLLQAGADDLAQDGFARRLAQLAAMAIQEDDEELKEIVKANVPWLLSYYKLKAINATNAAIFGVLDLLMGAFSRVLGPLGALGGLVVPTPTPTKRDPLQ